MELLLQAICPYSIRILAKPATHGSFSGLGSDPEIAFSATQKATGDQLLTASPVNT